MNTKLTLNIEKALIENAKKYAQENRRSLSSIVQNYLKILTSDSDFPDNVNISPVVKNLSGIISLSDNYSSKEEYHKHIIEKYT